ncbi:helix-turn-helix domain-containing protein [Spongiactinospora rosea]|uniref:helix-turn-helix domain-containing protein n=1 Tax=Spongiactinospora rosea TaxID=2248750 RepID=UPI0011C06341|nr:helix-turn-helix transcriptional regulator [Spongiactinospora rosea]
MTTHLPRAQRGTPGGGPGDRAGDLEADPERRVAARLAELRREHGLTLTALAEWTGISTAHLSRMEKGDRQPSIGSLIQLSRAYGISLSELIGDVRSREHHIVRGASAPVRQGQDGQYAIMSGLGPRSALEAVRLELTAGRPERTATHQGEEWVYVVGGQVVAVVGDDEITLDTGDALHFDAAAAHSLRAADGQATVLIVSAALPAVRPPHGPGTA